MKRFIFVFLFFLAGHAQAALNDDFTIGSESSILPFFGDPANGTASYNAGLDEIIITGADYQDDEDNAFFDSLTSFSITATSAGSLSFEWELTSALKQLST